MVSEIKKLDPQLSNFEEEEEEMDMDLGGDIEDEENPFYEEDENGEEFMQ